MPKRTAEHVPLRSRSITGRAERRRETASDPSERTGSGSTIAASTEDARMWVRTSSPSCRSGDPPPVGSWPGGGTRSRTRRSAPPPEARSRRGTDDRREARRRARERGPVTVTLMTRWRTSGDRRRRERDPGVRFRTGVVYRFDREQRGCACDRIEALGCPVRDADARGDQVVPAFLAADAETLRDGITDPKSQFESVSVDRLLRSDPADPDRSESDLAVVDRRTHRPPARGANRRLRDGLLRAPARGQR